MFSHRKTSSYWNSDVSIYEDVATVLEEDNSLVINITGEVQR